MSVALLDGATIMGFVNDELAFNTSMEARFSHLDSDHDGLLSYSEMLRELRCLRLFDTHFGIDVKPDPDELSATYAHAFVLFDRDSSGKVDFDEFKAETRRMMNAVAAGLGFLPVHMLLEEDSLLKTAVDCELSKLNAAVAAYLTSI